MRAVSGDRHGMDGLLIVDYRAKYRNGGQLVVRSLLVERLVPLEQLPVPKLVELPVRELVPLQLERLVLLELVA